MPTPRSACAVRAARPHIERVREELLRGESFDAATRTRPIVLAMSDIGEMAFFPWLLTHFRSEAPNCGMSTIRKSDDELPHGLERGDVDVAVGFFPNLALRNIRQRRLASHSFACLMRKDHPCWKPRLTVDDFFAVEHVFVRPQGRTSEELLERFVRCRERLGGLLKFYYGEAA